MRKFALAAAVVAGIGLAGCATGPYGNNGGYNDGYRNQGVQQGTTYQGRRDRRNCNQCGVVQDVRQVSMNGNNGNGSGHGGTLGAIIGAVAGGVLGNQVGKGDGRKAATVVGAVAGGAVGHEVGERSGGQSSAWQVQVRLDDGRYATVTQRENPGVRSGDYVQVRNNHVYAY